MWHKSVVLDGVFLLFVTKHWYSYFLVTLSVWDRPSQSWEKFDDDDEVQEEVMTWVKGLGADFYDSGIQKLIPRLTKCLDNSDDSVEK